VTDFGSLQRQIVTLLRELPDFLFHPPAGGTWFTSAKTKVQIYRDGPRGVPAEALYLARLLLAQVPRDPTSRRALGELLASSVNDEFAGAIAVLMIDTKTLWAFDRERSSPVSFAAFLDGAYARMVYEPESIGTDELFQLQLFIAIADQRVREAPKDSTGTQHAWRALRAAAKQLTQLIEYFEYLRIRQDILQRDNPQIDSDRVALISRFRSLGFSGPLEGVLEKVDTAFTASADVFDFHGAMGLVRAALEQIVEQSGRRDAIAVPLEDKLGESPARFSRAVSLLTRTQLLTDREASALQAFYNMVSVEGAHAWGTAREQARLSKNMMIEWGLLIVTRVREA
jgi:hypothetical protein